MNIAKAILKGTAIGVIGAGVAVGYIAYKAFKEEECMEGYDSDSIVEKAYGVAHKVKTKGMEIAAAGLDKVVQACDIVGDAVASAGIAADELHEDLETEIQLRHITDEAVEDDEDDDDGYEDDYEDECDDADCDEGDDEDIDAKADEAAGDDEVIDLGVRITESVLDKPRFDNLEQARAYDRLLNYLGSFAAVTEYMLQLSHVDSWDYAKALMIYECTHAAPEE